MNPIIHKMDFNALYSISISNIDPTSNVICKTLLHKWLVGNGQKAVLMPVSYNTGYNDVSNNVTTATSYLTLSYTNEVKIKTVTVNIQFSHYNWYDKIRRNISGWTMDCSNQLIKPFTTVASTTKTIFDFSFNTTHFVAIIPS